MIGITTEEKKKWANKIFLKIFLAFFIAFFALYVSEATGYYEFEQHKKVTLTQEKIKQFEEDVAAGKNVDIVDYMGEKEINYQTKISDMGFKLSEELGKYVQDGLEATFAFLNEMIEG